MRFRPGFIVLAAIARIASLIGESYVLTPIAEKSTLTVPPFPDWLQPTTAVLPVTIGEWHLLLDAFL